MEQNKSVIDKLLKESVTSNHVSDVGPTLQAFTRATRSLIYEDLVAVQETQQPSAALYGVRYLNSNGDMSYLSHATYSGVINDRSKIGEVEIKEYKKGEVFKKEDIVYIVISETYTPESTEYEALGKGLIDNSIRYFSDSSLTEDLEDSEIAVAGMKIDKWTSYVRSRKLKTSFTRELLRDMEANKIESDNVVIDLLSTVVSEEVNKNIIQTLGTVSYRHDTSDTPGAILDLSGLDKDDPRLGRILYRICNDMAGNVRRDTTFECTYVLGSTKVIEALKSSGWSKPDPDKPLSQGQLKNGLHLYSDDTTPSDYMLVGLKHKKRDMELVGSLFYSPYLSELLTVMDTSSFNENVAIIHRAALSVNPYTLYDEKAETALNIKSDDWDVLAGKSKMSRIAMVKLP